MLFISLVDSLIINIINFKYFFRDTCGAFTDDLTTEEVLLQARLAAREAAHRLATKKPNPKVN
jgi:hypothetical protein